MNERQYSDRDLEERKKALASAEEDSNKLDEIKRLGSPVVWATELGLIVGNDLSRLSQGFEGVVAKKSLEGITQSLAKLAKRPVLAPAFLEGIMLSLEENDILPKRLNQ